MTVDDFLTMAWQLSYREILRDEYPRDARLCRDENGYINIINARGEVIGCFDLIMGTHWKKPT